MDADPAAKFRIIFFVSMLISLVSRRCIKLDYVQQDSRYGKINLSGFILQ